MNIEELTTLDKLNKAFYESARVSAWKESTHKYRKELIFNNLKLQKELRNGTYEVRSTYNFTLNERGKIRNIEAPCMRDRIVQKILVQQILKPNLRKYFIYDNYASLDGRGTEKARKRIDVMLHKYFRRYGNNGYVLQLDIRKYFENVDHEILKQKLHQRIHEPKEIMDLIDYTVDTSSKTDKGLNLGSEAPQIYALYFLSDLDNYIKNVKGVKYYGRYMDDMIIIHHDKEFLKELLNDIEYELTKLKLEINVKKTHIVKLSHGFTFLQIKYNLTDTGKVIKRLTRTKIVRERRRLKKFKRLYDKNEMFENDIYQCYQSWRGTIVKDCNCCHHSIVSMDKLYNELFQPHKKVKVTQKDVLKQIYKEVKYEDFRHTRQFA